MLKNGKFARLRVKAVFLLEAHKEKDVIRALARISFLRLPPRRDQIREIFGPLTFGENKRRRPLVGLRFARCLSSVILAKG